MAAGTSAVPLNLNRGPNLMQRCQCRVGVMADNGVTYNSSVTYQHAVAHDPDVRTQPCETLSLATWDLLQDDVMQDDAHCASQALADGSTLTRPVCARSS